MGASGSGEGAKFSVAHTLPHEDHGITEKALDQQKEMDPAAQATALDRQRQGLMLNVGIHTNLHWPANFLKHSTSKSDMVLKMTNAHLQANTHPQQPLLF